jgi:hypothetical protein
LAQEPAGDGEGEALDVPVPDGEAAGPDGEAAEGWRLLLGDALAEAAALGDGDGLACGVVKKPPAPHSIANSTIPTNVATTPTT